MPALRSGALSERRLIIKPVSVPNVLAHGCSSAQMAWMCVGRVAGLSPLAEEL